jgi:hypothetical protein
LDEYKDVLTKEKDLLSQLPPSIGSKDFKISILKTRNELLMKRVDVETFKRELTTWSIPRMVKKVV